MTECRQTLHPARGRLGLITCAVLSGALQHPWSLPPKCCSCDNQKCFQLLPCRAQPSLSPWCRPVNKTVSSLTERLQEDAPNPLEGVGGAAVYNTAPPQSQLSSLSCYPLISCGAVLSPQSSVSSSWPRGLPPPPAVEAPRGGGHVCLAHHITPPGWQCGVRRHPVDEETVPSWGLLWLKGIAGRGRRVCPRQGGGAGLAGGGIGQRALVGAALSRALSSGERGPCCPLPGRLCFPVVRVSQVAGFCGERAAGALATELGLLH